MLESAKRGAHEHHDCMIAMIACQVSPIIKNLFLKIKNRFSILSIIKVLYIIGGLILLHYFLLIEYVILNLKTHSILKLARIETFTKWYFTIQNLMKY